MFGISGFELLVIMIIGLLVLGPKDFPLVAAKIVRWAKKGRAMVADMQTAMDEAVSLEEIRNMKQDISKLEKGLDEALEYAADETQQWDADASEMIDDVPEMADLHPDLDAPEPVKEDIDRAEAEPEATDEQPDHDSNTKVTAS